MIVLLSSLFFSLSSFAEMNTKVYGYIDGYWEKMGDSPQIGTNKKIKNPSEFAPNIHALILSSQDSYEAFLNISGDGNDDTLDVRNAWVQKELAGEALSFRIGKLYRKFGLYNEILDAVPTYIGIEPPEMLDADHLLLTRTTNAMLHGKVGLDQTEAQLHYSFTTGNDERKVDAQSFGADVHFTWATNWKLGASYYTSGGRAVSDQQGFGNPAGSGAVLNWMLHDTYDVAGLYLQYTDAKWIVQLESFHSNHKAVRDSAVVTQLCNSSDVTLNNRQRLRFNCGGTIDTDADYSVSSSYIRAGYIIPLEKGSITPYLQYDAYDNVEAIWQSEFGGDKESGLSDNGQFVKATLGAVYRPDFNVAIKADYSQHIQDVNDKQAHYDEVRFSFSYFWSLR